MSPATYSAVIAVLVIAQLLTTAMCAWLWSRVTSMPTHRDLEQLRTAISGLGDELRADITELSERTSETAERVAGVDATSKTTLASVQLIQSYLMERK